MLPSLMASKLKAHSKRGLASLFICIFNHLHNIIFHYGPEQKKKHSKNSHLFIHSSTTLWVSEWASKQTSERSRVHRWSEQDRASKLASVASEQANRQASGQVLTSGFLAVLDHSAIWLFAPWRYDSSLSRGFQCCQIAVLCFCVVLKVFFCFCFCVVLKAFFCF